MRIGRLWQENLRSAKLEDEGLLFNFHSLKNQHAACEVFSWAQEPVLVCPSTKIPMMTLKLEKPRPRMHFQGQSLCTYMYFFIDIPRWHRRWHAYPLLHPLSLRLSSRQFAVCVFSYKGFATICLSSPGTGKEIGKPKRDISRG